MYRLLVWTSKGGAGKTTTVANLGPELARRGLDVLMVGFDPSGDLETTYGVDEGDEGVERVEALLRRPEDVAAAGIDVPVESLGRRGWSLRNRARERGRLRLLPCSPALNECVGDLAARGYVDLDRLLTRFRGPDVALIDTQGALTPISHTAASAADGVLFTMEPGYFEFRALMARLVELETLRREGGARVDPVGVLFVRSDSRSRQMREYREHFSDAEALGGEHVHVFDTHTRQQASVRDHPRLGKPTALVEPGGHVASDYRAFADELIARLGLSTRNGRRA